MPFKTLIFFVVLLVFNHSSNLEILTVYTTDHGLPANDVRAVYVDNGQNIWAGTSSGAARLSEAGWVNEYILSRPVTTIFKDSKGNMWFGGIGELNMHNGAEVKRYSMKDDMHLEGRLVFSVMEDAQNNIWVATTGGAAKFNGVEWITSTTENGLGHNVVHGVAQDNKNNIWYATRKSGINIYDGKNWKYLYPEKNCRKIFKDSKGNMWVGTTSGLVLFDGKAWHTFEEGKTILPMFEGKKGYVWCIADGKNIFRVAADVDKKVYTYDNPVASEVGEIYDLGYDDQGAIWVGTDLGITVLH